MTGAELAFLPFGVLALAAAVAVVTTPQLVHAALWLVACLGAVAACFLILTAELLAWVQILIYVGAVVVLLLFGIMLTSAPIGRSARLNSGNRIVAAVIAAGVAVTLSLTLLPVLGGEHLAVAGDGAGGAKAIGEGIFGYWVLGFELLSMLLLGALIAAIVLSRWRRSTVR